MKNGKLNIGKIPYANLFPLFHCLEKNGNSSLYSFIEGPPSKLNKMLREGELDISPSSSIEYLKNKDQYRILPYLSVSSTGPIESILLFSRFPIKELDGKPIAVSSESETSSVLLRIILEEFLSLDSRLESTDISDVEALLSSFSAVMLIGDTALTETKKIRAHKPKNLHSLHIYDLGELWHKYTGLPFVFALWVVRKQSIDEKTDLIKALSEELMNAKKLACREYRSIVKDAPQREWMSEDELVEYWKLISYDLTENHMNGLRLFDEYAGKLQSSTGTKKHTSD